MSGDEDDELLEEGVDEDSIWAQPVQAVFEEALNVYPPCGRRKIVLATDGKMYGKLYIISNNWLYLLDSISRPTVAICCHFHLDYAGRNELIARYIFEKTGQHRTRKQVSSAVLVRALFCIYFKIGGVVIFVRFCGIGSSHL
jgi:transcriptional enhancer factor